LSTSEKAKDRDGPRSPRIVRPGLLSNRQSGWWSVQRAGAPRLRRRLNTTWTDNLEKCRDRHLIRPPGLQVSVPCDRPADRRRGTCQRSEKAPRPCSKSLDSSSRPFPPSCGPKSGKGSAPGRFRYRAVPRRASTVPHPRPSRRHPPELACRSGRFGSGGSSSLLNQSKSTRPDFQILRKIFKTR
jgi:hypothetical protein